MDHGERLPRALGDHLAIALGDEPAIPGGVSLDAALPGASTFRWRAWKQYDFPRSGAWRETARPSGCNYQIFSGVAPQIVTVLSEGRVERWAVPDDLPGTVSGCRLFRAVKTASRDGHDA